jgi:hypothetical protein
MFLCPARNIYRRDTDYGNDKCNHGNIGGGPEDLWDCDERAKEGVSEYVSDWLRMNLH